MGKEEVFKLIDLLKDERNTKTSHTQRRETAAWTSAVFFITLLGLFYNFIITKFLLNISPNPILNFLLVTFILLLLFWTFFKFIHAQFASLYHSTARCKVYDQVIFDLINKGDNFLKENVINSFVDLDDRYVFKLAESIIKNNLQKFRGILHPLFIVLYFWKYLPLPIFICIPIHIFKYIPIPIIYFIICIIEKIYPEFKDNDEKKMWYKTKKLNNIERQEGALYSLLILTTSVLLFIVYYLLFLKGSESNCFIDLNSI